MVRLSGPWSGSYDTCGGQKRFRRFMIATQPAGLADITVEVPDTGPGCSLKGTSQPITAALKAFADFAGTVRASGPFSAGGGFDPSRPDGAGWIDQDGLVKAAPTLGRGARRQHPVRANEPLWVTGSTAVATPTFVDHPMGQSLQGQGGPTTENLSGGCPAAPRIGMTHTCEGDRLTTMGMLNQLTEQQEPTHVRA